MLGLTSRKGPSFTQLISRAAQCHDLPLGRQITYSLPKFQGASAAQRSIALCPQ